MRTMNRRINLPGIQKIMMDFEKQNMTMELKEEMMNESIDEALNEEGEEEETDEVVNKVLDEIGISMGEQVSEMIYCLLITLGPSCLQRLQVH